VIENETVIAERDYRHLQTVIINPLNINSCHSLTCTKILQPANLTTYTILSLFSLQAEPAPHLLSP